MKRTLLLLVTALLLAIGYACAPTYTSSPIWSQDHTQGGGQGTQPGASAPPTVTPTHQPPQAAPPSAIDPDGPTDEDL